MPIYRDQLNREVILTGIPKRIISLVPSQTELLFYLGLAEEVIGITKFCVHPSEWFRTKTRIGGTKTVNIDKVISLRPDLIIANKEENTKEQIEALEKIAPVWISDINNIPDALEMIRSIGEITGKVSAATNLIEEIEKEFSTLQSLIENHQYKKYRTAYFIWKDPYMSVGSDTFIHAMLSFNGLENVFAEKERYPVIDCEEMKERNTELILLSSEPYPFKQKHIDELQRALPSARILLVDGEMFSWYGSRMKYAAAYFTTLFQQISR